MVGSCHGAHPVGNDQHRLALKQTGEGGLDGAFVLHVQAGGGLIQQHHRRVLQQGPGDGDPLPLPAGEGGTVLPDHRLIALGQLADELVALGGLGGFQHLLIGGAPAAQADVLHHRVPKQHHVLEHHGVGAQEGLRVHRGHVRPAQGHLPAGDIPKPGGQLAGGRLPAAGGSDKGGDFPLAGGEAHILQHPCTLPVGKGDMVKGDVVAVGAEILRSRLNRLFQNGAHPFNL